MPTPFGGGCTRSASGKKKKNMIMKHAVTEITNIQRISAFSNFKCMKYPMISADLIIDRTKSTSSIRTGENTCLYPSTTSIAVSTSSAPQTQKYCPLLSSCVAASCIEFILAFDRAYSRSCSNSSRFWVAQRFQRCDQASSPTRALAPAVPAFLRHLGRQQIHQRENKHPHQIDEVPVQPRHFHILRVIILRLQKQDDRRHNQS